MWKAARSQEMARTAPLLPPKEGRGRIIHFVPPLVTTLSEKAWLTLPVLLAHLHNPTRLCDSVRQATSQAQRRSRDFGGSPRRTCLVRGDCCPPGKGCNRAGPSSRDEAGVSPYFIVPRKAVAFGQSWICESRIGPFSSSH